MNPAALSALVAGNADNYLAALKPGGIEEQEKQGQIDQSLRETLPILGSSGADRARWEALGFTFHGNADELFVNCTFPKGWHKQPTDHSMWTDLRDGQNTVRATIFYKAAFYDRCARVTLLNDPPANQNPPGQIQSQGGQNP